MRELILERQKKVIILMLSVTVCMSACFRPLHVAEGPSFNSIQEGIKSSNINERLVAIEQLRNSHDEQTVDLLISVVGNRREDWEVQVKAIQLLGEAKNPKALDLLLYISNSHSRDWECPSVKSYTALALSNFGGQPGVFEALTKGLHDPELLTREASVKALGIIGDEQALPLLIPLLHDKSIALRLSVIKALENIGSREAIPALQMIVENDQDEIVRDTAKIALANFQ